MSTSFCAVPLPRLIYAGPRSKEEFDRIALPEEIHDWQHDKFETLRRNDGVQYDRRCHAKVLEDHKPDTITVIFQWFEFRPSIALASSAAADQPHKAAA